MSMRTAIGFCALVISLAGSAFAQDNAQPGPRPMFAHPARRAALGASVPAASLQTFTQTYDFLGDGGNQAVTIVGTDPSSSDVATTIPTFIVPIKMVFSDPKPGTFDPNDTLPNGNTVIQNTISSPIFQSGIDFVQGGTNVGKTQYTDAYERGNFWTDVMINTHYHLLLGSPTVLPEQTLNVPKSKGTVTENPFGPGTVGIANINWFFTELLTIMANLPQIKPNTFPIFELHNVYLSNNSGLGGCCIGGFHDAVGTQTFAEFDYEDAAGSFSQDVSALSHEVGEWIVDPFVDNTACGGLMEVGDPLEAGPNFGAFPYTLNGFTYNLQDLVFLQYFGQGPSTSVNGWESFQNASLTTCSNGP